MGVYLKWRGKKLSPLWWGFWQADGKRHEVSICPWRGKPPKKGAGKAAKGDADFEQSRGEAEEKFAAMTSQERSKADRAALVEKIHALRYGGKVERVKIADLWEKWEAMPHKAGEERRKRVRSVLKLFSEFMEGNHPNVSEAGALTAEHFKGFLKEVEERGVSARTWNDYLFTLRSVLSKAGCEGGGYRDYLAQLPYKDETPVHRRPFTGEELEGLFRAAAEVDPGLHPVIVAAACTALRRGDVARLRWKDIDLAGGFATVKTTKTGERVEIPIFPPFMAVLREADRKKRKGNPYVFPEVAEDYKMERNRLDRRLKKVLAAAGFVRPEKGKEEESGRETLAAVGDEARKNRGSLCGWHSFRTTFCSLALANGVPMELLTRITGHRTAEIVEKYYNQAKREQARRAFGAAMPKAIAGAVEGAGEADFVMVGFPPEREEGAKRLADASEEDWKRALAALGRGKRRKKG